MKAFTVLFMVVVVLMTTLPSAAQSPGNASLPAPEYIDLLYVLDGAYLRFEDGPIRVCQITPDEEWSSLIQLAVDYLSQVVAIEFNREFEYSAAPFLEGCDIEIVLPFDLEFIAGTPYDGRPPIGRTYYLRREDGRLYVRVYIERDTPYRQHTVFHELLHALGIAGHTENPDDVLNVSTWQLYPSDAEMNLLVWIYQQPAIYWQ